ncbi:MAG: bifunctional UDP-N-acetylglucosamine pyrophosphorylase / glucosamine-phosphate N-acetyltransferase, partial [Gaiellaceae bacterium]|nr:bifunctional UDP-N-acetylglucosamine pyrophosphorylase / glucosamine-phosphate N-acetyltransferase [Gaiellaceae bacterium]
MAGGLGTRMHSATPKHLHPLLGRRMVDWVIAAAAGAGADPVVVVASPDTRDAFEGVTVAVQETPLGTGDAVRAARAALDGEWGAMTGFQRAAAMRRLAAIITR